ncbi:MAG: LmbE family protein [Flammeovirgaceae bacterium]|nr:LmbE family protein [Flammeovirgaceae bacterium]
MSTKKSLLIILFYFISNQILSQSNNFYSASNISSMLEKLDVFGKVLYIAAHPDDENTRLIAYLANEKKYETAYLSATRGGGGQNFLGTHLKDNLGLIRTQELLEARKIDGGQQFFTSAIDFGYSKEPIETLNFWNEEKILSDFVWIIRKFRPDIIITRFNQTPYITHGHHTASTMLADKAFNLAGDPSAFPEQLKHVKIWKPKRLMWNTSRRFFNLDDYDIDKMIKIDVGVYNNKIGKSYNEIASESRSMHKSQAFGSLRRRGSEVELIVHTQGVKAENDIMDGVDTSWDRIKPNNALKSYLRQAKDSFNIDKPYQIIDYLSLAHRELNRVFDRDWRSIKKNEIKNLIKASSGLFFEALSNVELASYGEEVKIKFDVINRSPYPIKLDKIQLNEKEFIIDDSLKNNKLFSVEKSFQLPLEHEVSEKYWLKNPSEFGSYNIDDQKLITEPDNKPVLEAKFIFKVNGQQISYISPVTYKLNSPINGDEYRPFNIGNPIYLNPKNDLEYLVNTNKKNLEVEVISGANNISARIYLDAPEGTKVDPEFYDINFKNNNEKKLLNFNVSLSDNKNSINKVSYKAKIDDKIFSRGINKIIYSHISHQTRFPKSEVSLIKFDLNVKAKNIAYIMGSGDKIPESLSLVGYKVDLFEKNDINIDNLKDYDALIVGVRAFNSDKSLLDIKPQLMNFMESGGNVIIQYNTSRNLDVNKFSPYPFTLSRNRVSQENAPVRIINSKHPALNYPNKISLEDFNGWVQERGLYFPNSWSNDFETIISSNDKGESPNNGGILISKVGEGYFVYTSYSWFRQLPAGVSGAYKIFTNLISLGKK